MTTELEWTRTSGITEVACVLRTTYVLTKVDSPPRAPQRLSVYVIDPDKYDKEFEVLGRDLTRAICKRIAATHAKENP